METFSHYINGNFVSAMSGESFDSTDPYSGEVWARIARGSSEDVDAAVTAAKDAMKGEWSTLSVRHRVSGCVRKTGGLI